MPGRKMSMVASLCAKPSKWARPVTTPTTSTTVVTPPTPTAAFVNPHGSLSLSLALNNSSTGVRTIKLLPCARLVSNKYDNNSLCNNSNNNSNKALALGFTFRGRNNKNKYLSLFSRENFTLASSSFSSSSSSSSSAHKSGGLPESDSPSAGPGVVADMGSEDKVDDADWYHHDDDHRRNDPNSPSSVSSPLQKHLHQQSHSKFLTLPTVLTLARVAAVPLLVCTFYVDTWWGRTATTSIFITAAITDWLDGYLARKMRLGSAFGAFLDPVADKLMVAATLVLLCSRPLEVAMFGQMPWLLTVPSIAIIGREITMSAVREWAASQNGKLSEAVAVNNLGKWKTATQMTALIILLATRDSSLGGAGILVASGVILLYISAGLSVWSLAVYMSRIWSVLLK